MTLAYFAWPSQWGGDTTFVIVRGTSMQPSFHTGDMVIARQSDDHEVGDVLVYAVPDGYAGAGKLIMHRLKSIDADGRYTIQGDNRNEPDQFDVGREDVVGVALTHVPKVGVVTQVLGQWWLIAGLIGLFAMVKVWPHHQDGEKADETDDRAASGDGQWHQGDERRLEVDRRAAVAAAGPTVVSDAEPWPAPLLVEAASAPRSPAPPPPPPARVRRTQPYVVVDGLALAHVGWPTVELAVTRQMAVDAADDIAGRFGTVAAVIFEPSTRPVSNRRNAQVQFAPAAATLADVVRTHLDGRRPGLTMLVVTDASSVAEEVWALGGSVMRCEAWLALGQADQHQ